MIGDLGHLYYRMNESWVGIRLYTLLDFTKGFEETMEQKVEFIIGRANVRTKFYELASQYTSDPVYERVLLGSLFENINKFLLEDEKPEGKIVLLETVECFDGIAYDDFLKVSNKEVFKDLFYSGGL